MISKANLPPPVIYHIPKRPANYKKIIEAASKNIHLRQQEKRLLLLYAGQAKGFRPSLSFIEANTGIAENKVSEIRARLVKHGLIYYDRQEHKISIAWDRINAFALLEKPLLLTRGKHTFYPFDPSGYFARPEKRTHTPIKQNRLAPIPLTLEQQRQLSVLQRMSQDEYNDALAIQTKEMAAPGQSEPPDIIILVFPEKRGYITIDANSFLHDRL